jgi:hypothetical protein
MCGGLIAYFIFLQNQAAFLKEIIDMTPCFM